MKATPSSILTVTAAVLALASLTSTAQIPTFASADLVLGQPDFVSDGTSPVSSTSLNGPGGIAIDPTTGKVFVADRGNHRILRYASAASLANGASAEIAFGQLSFSGSVANHQGGAIAGNTLFSPTGLFVDAAGRLWVADTGNHRVLMFEHASDRVMAPHADRVFGQFNFTTNTADTTATKMDFPRGVWIDAAGNLWVADSSSHRVLRFANAAAKTNGAAADQVLGQANFVSNGTAVSATRMQAPYGVSVDVTGTLWVADSFNQRILRFSNAATLADGAAADFVLGQPDFVSSAPATTASGMFFPRMAVADPAGALWVSDGNDRLLRFDAVATKSSGAAADGVLGQADFVSFSSGLAANQLALNSAPPLFVDPAGNLWSADGNNNRVLRFTRPIPATPTSTPTIDTTPPTLKVRGRKSIETLRKRIVLRGTASDNATVASISVDPGRGAQVKKVRGTTNWKAVLRVTKTTGRVVVKIRATDATGNRSATSRVRLLRR